MTMNARDALRHFTAALEAHLEAVEQRRSAEDAVVDDAFDAVAEAFERYEEALDAEYGESLPVVLDDDDDDDGEDDGDDDDFDDDPLDPHAEENEDDMDDDIEEFDLR
jgi:hypothetical protein